MSSQTFQLAQQLEEAFNSVGASMVSMNFAAKLLAYVYVMGDDTPWLHQIYSRYNIINNKSQNKNGK